MQNSRIDGVPTRGGGGGAAEPGSYMQHDSDNTHTHRNCNLFNMTQCFHDTRLDPALDIIDDVIS